MLKRLYCNAANNIATSATAVMAMRVHPSNAPIQSKGEEGCCARPLTADKKGTAASLQAAPKKNTHNTHMHAQFSAANEQFAAHKMIY